MRNLSGQTWDNHGTRMGQKWDILGHHVLFHMIEMVYGWITRGLPVVYPWFTGGLPVVYLKKHHSRVFNLSVAVLIVCCCCRSTVARLEDVVAMMMLPFVCLVWLLVLQAVPVRGHWRSYCETKNLPLVKLGRMREDSQLDPHSNISFDSPSFVVLGRWEAGDPEAPDLEVEVEAGGQVRRLHDGSDHSHTHPPVSLALNASESESEFEKSESLEVYYAKECTCFHEMYSEFEISLCPLATTDCREVINNHVQGFPRMVTCYERKEGQKKFMQATIGVWLVFTTCLFLTHRGRSALSYIPAKLFPCWNPIVAAFALKYRQKFANFLIRNHILVQEELLLRQVQQRSLGIDTSTTATTTTAVIPTDGITAFEMATMTIQPPAPKLPTSLRLKTRVVRPEELHRLLERQAQDWQQDPDRDPDSPNEQQLLCTICLGEIQPGNRVGDFRDFQCQHLFHVECLKLWLQRRNTCPLCQTQQVAEPVFESVEEGRIGSTASTEELSNNEQSTASVSQLEEDTA